VATVFSHVMLSACYAPPQFPSSLKVFVLVKHYQQFSIFVAVIFHCLVLLSFISELCKALRGSTGAQGSVMLIAAIISLLTVALIERCIRISGLTRGTSLKLPSFSEVKCMAVLTVASCLMLPESSVSSL